MRTVRDIYQQIVDEKNKRLELSEINSSSKVSVLNAIIWIVAVGIYTHEAVFRAFGADVSEFIDRKIHGTADYYANCLLKYQHGDDLVIRDDYTGFGYADIDSSKQIITKVAYSEYSTDMEKDQRVLYKVATGDAGSLRPITPEQLTAVKGYLDKIKFLGTNIDVTSKSGDVLVPRLTVYHDGQLPESNLLDIIDAELKRFMSRLTFDANVKKTDIMDVVKHIDHVTDVYIDKTTKPEGGIYIYQYLNESELDEVKELDRVLDLASGYLVESSRVGLEKDIPTFKESLTLKVESNV